MRKYILIALLLVTAGVGVSYFLLPSAMDTQHAKLRDQQTIDIGNVDVEAEYNQGRRSFAIVAALADKRIMEGNRPAAITLLEEYIKTNPNDAAGRKKLAEQYMLAARKDDYNAQIQALANLEPTEENLLQLSYIYNADKNYPKQAEVLQKIVVVTNGNKPKSYTDLATIQLVIGDKEAALQTINDLKAKHPDYRDYAIARIRVSILIEKGDVDTALAEAKQWVDAERGAVPSPSSAPVPPSASPNAQVGAVPNPTSREAQELADLCNIFHYSGHADKALALVTPHLDLVETSSELAVAYVNASITAGHADEAYQLLTKLDAAGKISPDLSVPYLQLAFKREDIAAATKIVETANLPQFNEEQTLNFVETARSGNNSVLSTLLARLNTPEALKDKPVLSAVIGMLTNATDQDKRIDTALHATLSSVQRLRLAESCARAGKKACFDTILAQYPKVDQMTTPQIMEYAQLYIIAKRPADILAPVGTEATKPGAHPEVMNAYIRLAAAAGDQRLMAPWLATNAAVVPIAKLQELYYLANERNPALAADIADRLYARDPSPMNRDMLVASYIATNQHAKALPLLRETMKNPNVDDGYYLAALNKLARKDAAARKELTDYALTALQSDKGDDRAQLNYAYTLLSNGQRPAVLPFIKSNAESRGGEWKKMYAQLTSPSSKGGIAKKLSREELLKLANNPKIKPSNKRQVAYTLLKDGHKTDALALFQQLAADKGPDSQEVKDLLYLWGGKLTATQMGWIQARAKAANGYDKQKWAELIAGYGDDRTAIEYVSAMPDALYNKKLRLKYFRAVAARGSTQDYDLTMRNWVAQTTDVAALVDYAATAQAYGYSNAAQNGYSRVVQLDPRHAKALAALSSLTMAKGNYSQAHQYTDRALAEERVQRQPDIDISITHYNKAQLLKSQGRTAEAQSAFQAVIQAVRQSGSQSPDALSRMYQAQFNVGQGDAAVAGFRALLAKNPENKGVLADFMSALIEHKYYDEAARVANQYDKTSPNYGKQSAVSQQKTRLAFATADTVTYYTKLAQESYAIVPTRVQEVPPQVEMKRQEDLRLQLLYARIELETGQADRARQRLELLNQYYPGDPQLLSFQASMENLRGNREKATELLQQAQAQAPENESIAQMLSDTTRAPQTVNQTGQQYVKLDHEYRKYGAPSEHITTLSGVVRISPKNELGMSVANDYIQPKNLTEPTNEVGPGAADYKKHKDASKQYGEVYLAHYFDNGSRLQGSLFASGQLSDTTNRDIFDNSTTISNNGDLGGGLYYGFNTRLGRTEALAEYNRPYWDFAWASYYNASRDRVGFKHYAALTPRTSIGIETSLNNYSILPVKQHFPGIPLTREYPESDDLEQTGLFRLSLVHQLQAETERRPYFGIAYGFDGEYIIDRTMVDTTPGNRRQVFQLSERDVSQLSAIYRANWTPRTRAMFSAGWVADFYSNTDGPLVEGNITQDLTKKLELGVRGRYSRISSYSDSNAVDVGTHLKYKF